MELYLDPDFNQSDKLCLIQFFKSVTKYLNYKVTFNTYFM